MTKLAPGFHLFGTGKVFVRSLVIYQCLFKEELTEKNLVSIKRVYKELDDSYRHEDTDMDYAIFPKGGTFHLHDIFLTNSFGITVRFLSRQGQFEIFDLKSNIEAQPLLLFQTLNGEEILLLSHLEANAIA